MSATNPTALITGSQFPVYALKEKMKDKTKGELFSGCESRQDGGFNIKSTNCNVTITSLGKVTFTPSPNAKLPDDLVVAMSKINNITEQLQKFQTQNNLPLNPFGTTLKFNIQAGNDQASRNTTMNLLKSLDKENLLSNCIISFPTQGNKPAKQYIRDAQSFEQDVNFIKIVGQYPSPSKETAQKLFDQCFPKNKSIINLNKSELESMLESKTPNAAMQCALDIVERRVAKAIQNNFPGLEGFEKYKSDLEKERINQARKEGAAASNQQSSILTAQAASNLHTTVSATIPAAAATNPHPNAPPPEKRNAPPPEADDTTPLRNRR